MYYISTRGAGKIRVTPSRAVVDGLAPDGGLYVPEQFPALPLDEFVGLPCEKISLNVLKRYFTDFTAGELEGYIRAAYADSLPVKLSENGGYLELFHGNTGSFKDMALQLFPHLMTAALRKNNCAKTALILTATSGDTGSAVLSGVADVPGIRAVVFFPHGGVSSIQQLQMTAQEGGNLHVFALRGSFDDAQQAVKQVFADERFKARFPDCLFTSANSINIARLLPQIAHFLYGYSELVSSGRINAGDKINFAVPTGNFGNILSAYYAKKMGLPVNKLICANNINRVLDVFFKSGAGEYNPAGHKLELTVSPAIDILAPSNFERYLYEKLPMGSRRRMMDAVKADFASGYATDEETMETIKSVYASGYLIDPHTAVAKFVYEKYRRQTGDETPTLITATASPYKFPETTRQALGSVLTDPPPKIAALYGKPVLHDAVTDNVRQAIEAVLK